jgi:dihydroneopterin aldolase
MVEGRRPGGDPVTDRVILAGMVFAGRHGVLEVERREPQPFEVDVELALDLRAAGTTDELARTIDYGEVFEACRAIVEGPAVRLVETLAERIAVALLAGFPPAAEVVVRVRKPRAPLPGTFAWAGVEVRRLRR